MMTSSKLVNRFEYTPMSRVNIDGKRHYATPDGNKIPSVTTILDKTKSEESKAGLQAWRDWVGHAKAQQITTESAAVGTAMHKMLENHILGESKQPGSNLVQKIAYPMAQTVISEGLVNLNEVWGVEIPVYYPGLYAGTTDGAGVWKGKETIFDHKQTNKKKERKYIDDYYVQLAGYSLAHNEIHGTNIKTGVLFMCSRDCEYQEWVLEGAEFQKYTDIWLTRVEEFYRLKSINTLLEG
jgi:genome maintenance exonuclease 1